MTLGVDIKVFNSFLYEPIYEKTAQMIEAFNANSAGSIVLTNTANIGDFSARMFWANLDSAQYRRNIYLDESVSNTDLAQQQQNSIKVAGGVGPIEWVPGQLSWIQRSPAEAINVISTAVAEMIVKDQLNTIILSAIAATQGTNAAAAGAVNNAFEDNSFAGNTAGTPLSQVALNNGMANMGDASQTIIAHVMSGSSWHALIGDAIVNSNALDTVGGVAIMTGTAFGQGRPIIVTDAPAFKFSTDGYY